jgi:2-C-methyl-D-erythritol 2,4-cyclodiphosphate synthase
MIRIGQGVDIHPFDDSRPLILGGVKISDRGGLKGHSDADVVLHALTDALLGATGSGDIGKYFPSEDPKWKGADSSRFVAEARHIVEEMSGDVSNVDITIIAEKPKLAPFRDAMEAKIARMLDIPSGHVNVKATTADHLGFIGRGEGICAMAIVLITIGSSGDERSPVEGVL